MVVLYQSTGRRWVVLQAIWNACERGLEPQRPTYENVDNDARRSSWVSLVRRSWAADVLEADVYQAGLCQTKKHMCTR